MAEQTRVFYLPENSTEVTKVYGLLTDRDLQPFVAYEISQSTIVNGYLYGGWIWDFQMDQYGDEAVSDLKRRFNVDYPKG
jgi:hypothetical protein